MTDGSSKILGIADSVGNKATSAAISSDGRLVAAGSYEGVCDLSSDSFVGVHSKCNSYRWYASWTLAPVSCWRRCGDTETPCTAWRSPLMGVDW